MVHQVEAETADLGMNGGAGRIPSGFCTLTCAVYKWAQLHETVLKSYPSGPSDNPAFREYYTKWQAESPDSGRESAMKKAYYELAVQNPGAVAWYCGLKLKIALALTKALLAEQMRSAEVPGLEEAKAKLAEELRRCLGVDLDSTWMRFRTWRSSAMWTPNTSPLSGAQEGWFMFTWPSGSSARLVSIR